MKKRLFILLFLCSFLGFGQEYELWVSGDGSFTNVYDYSFCVTRQHFFIHYNDVNSVLYPNKKIFDTGIYTLSSNKSNISGNYKLSKDGVPGCGAACSEEGSFIFQKMQMIFIGRVGNVVTLDYCYPLKTTNIHNEDRLLHQSAVILPKYVQPEGLDRERVLSDKIFTSSVNNFNIPEAKIPYVKWQYQTDKDFGFKDFPEEIKNIFPMKATIDEVLKDEVWIDINTIKNIKIKRVFIPPVVTLTSTIWPTPYTHTTPTVESSIIILDILRPSPTLDSVKTQSSSCNYKADGGFTLNFNRNLNSEELVMTLYDGTDDSLIYDQEYTSTLTNNSGVYSYTWNKPLDAGSYRVKYQTHTGTGGIDEADDTWKSLEFSDSFTITPARPVDFQVTGSADQNCFKVNDGYIDISATGESSRTFLYQLTKDGVIQFFNGTSWVDYTGSNVEDETWFPFTNAQTTRINKLNKGAYSVKVRDSKKCLAKQL
ncbi:hypothetical protein D6T69_10975 [Tenacibaculum singaporense]|uniref:Uncharacterized protein n=1 Tax=Tenacibaculum singaporense TaxID=2358479 RepID=A0A3Q8RRY9_9FLAO|nr:hypothetical protein [Tenacibaculum singaporense]AZJ36016.1 hypothetical protein D6T69_10975 [Tenacibaculum singaporense]